MAGIGSVLGKLLGGATKAGANKNALNETVKKATQQAIKKGTEKASQTGINKINAIASNIDDDIYKAIANNPTKEAIREVAKATGNKKATEEAQKNIFTKFADVADKKSSQLESDWAGKLTKKTAEKFTKPNKAGKSMEDEFLELGIKKADQLNSLGEIPSNYFNNLRKYATNTEAGKYFPRMDVTGLDLTEAQMKQLSNLGSTGYNAMKSGGVNSVGQKYRSLAEAGLTSAKDAGRIPVDNVLTWRAQLNDTLQKQTNPAMKQAIKQELKNVDAHLQDVFTKDQVGAKNVLQNTIEDSIKNNTDPTTIKFLNKLSQKKNLTYKDINNAMNKAYTARAVGEDILSNNAKRQLNNGTGGFMQSSGINQFANEAIQPAVQQVGAKTIGTAGEIARAIGKDPRKALLYGAGGIGALAMLNGGSAGATDTSALGSISPQDGSLGENGINTPTQGVYGGGGDVLQGVANGRTGNIQNYANQLALLQQAQEPTIGGYTENQLENAYVKALMAGDNASAKVLESMLDRVVDKKATLQKSSSGTKSSSQKDKQTKAKTALQAVQAMGSDFGNPISEALGNIPLVGGLLSQLTGNGNFNANRDYASESLGRIQSGAALSKVEEERFKAMIPNSWDSDAVKKTKMARLQQLLNGYGAYEDDF